MNYEDEKTEAREKIIRADYKGAERIYKTLKAKNPSDLDLTIGLVDVYLNQNYPQKALALMEQEENKFGDDPLFYKHLCRVHRAIADRNNALKSIEKALLLDPENPTLISSLGFTYWFFDDPEKAIAQTEKALEFALKKNDPLTLIMIKNNLAYYYAETGKKENKAREYASFSYQNRTREGVDQFKRSFYTETYAYVKMKFTKNTAELDEALALFDEAIKEGAPLEIAIGHLKETYQKRKRLQKQTHLK